MASTIKTLDALGNEPHVMARLSALGLENIAPWCFCAAKTYRR
jgi:hypothetical protein